MAGVAIDLQTKTEVLLEALPYVQRFRQAIFVVKYGGSLIDEEPARLSVALDLTFLAAVGVRVVVVHGGGKAISRAMEEARIEPVFRDGLRVTDERTVQIVERVLNGDTNPALVASLTAQGGRPRGVKGQDVLMCHRLGHDDQGRPLDLGFVGEVEQVDADGLHALLELGRIPVLSPLARDGSGQIYNVNADTAAAHVAAALGARRLIYLSDIPGLLRNPRDPATLIPTVRIGEVEGLKQAGVISGGMRPKIDSAVRALREGVRRVHFIDGRVRHSLLLEIFTDHGVGTEIIPDAVPSEHGEA